MSMVAEDRAQRVIEQMGRRVRAHDCLAAVCVNRGSDSVAHGNGAGEKLAVVLNLPPLFF